MKSCVHAIACKRHMSDYFMDKYCGEACEAFETLEDFCGNNDLYTYEQCRACVHGATRDALSGYTDNCVEDYV